MRKRREHPGAAVFEKDVILNADTAPPGPVDARLDRDDGVVRKRRLGGPRQPWRFVYLDADPMAEAVTELVAETAVFNVAARDCVGIPPTHPCPDGSRRALVGLTNDRMDRSLLVARGTDNEGAGDVRAVASDHGPEVDQKKIPILHGALRRPCVRQRRAFAGGDDGRKRKAFAAAIAKRALEQ